VNGFEQVAARSQPHQLVIEIPYGGLGAMQMAFERQNDVRFAFPFAAQ
jgi:hypothetical protein